MKYDYLITGAENMEEQALSLVGRDVCEKLVKGYTERQWGSGCRDLPAFIIKRLPLRFAFNNNYFNDRYQGIPVGGYTKIVEKLLEGANVLLNTDYKEYVKQNPGSADKTVYTGMTDEYFNCSEGILEYCSVRFETEKLDIDKVIVSALNLASREFN